MIETIDLALILCYVCVDKFSCGCLCRTTKSNELRKLHKALATSGFVQIINHGIDFSVTSSAVSSSESFFSRSLESKMMHESRDKARRGYSPVLSENFASLVGESNKPNDAVEKFRVGPSVSSEMKSANPDYYESKEARVHFFENEWKDLGEDFVSSIKAYYEAMTRLSSDLLAVIATVAELKADFFDALIDKHTSIMSLNHYPVTKGFSRSSEVVTRVAEHTDVSVLTIVHQTVTAGDCDIGGLEVFDTTCGQWLKVPYADNAFVVNVGDCLSDWSRGLFKSSMHRVVMQESPDMLVDRYSLAYFFTPNYDAELVWGLDEVDENKTTYSNWRKNRIKRAMQMLKKQK